MPAAFHLYHFPLNASAADLTVCAVQVARKGWKKIWQKGGDFLFFHVAFIVAFLKRLWSRTLSKLDAVAGLLKEFIYKLSLNLNPYF